MNTLAIYTALLAQNISATAFDSDKNTITFDCTTNEILVVSKALAAIFLPNEIILTDSLTFNLRLL